MVVKRDSTQMTELEMAIRVALFTWPGTSLAEGAIEILREIYRAK